MLLRCVYAFPCSQERPSLVHLKPIQAQRIINTTTRGFLGITVIFLLPEVVWIVYVSCLSTFICCLLYIPECHLPMHAYQSTTYVPRYVALAASLP